MIYSVSQTSCENVSPIGWNSMKFGFSPKTQWYIFFKYLILGCSFCLINSLLWCTMLAKHYVTISARLNEVYWSWHFQVLKHNDIFLKYLILGWSFCLINSLSWCTMLAKHRVKISAKSDRKWSNGKHLPAIYPIQPGLYTVP